MSSLHIKILTDILNLPEVVVTSRISYLVFKRLPLARRRTLKSFLAALFTRSRPSTNHHPLRSSPRSLSMSSYNTQILHPDEQDPRHPLYQLQGPHNGGDGPEVRRQSQYEDDESESDGHDGGKKRKRPMSVSCELCKQRKVKCDRGQPTCGWCLRNNQVCEYKERKKPGLRAGYGRELEARLGEYLWTCL